METALIVELVRAAWRELLQWRVYVFSVFCIVTFAVLIVGLQWKENYQTGVMIYADHSNIIKPLLQGKAVVTKVDFSKAAREVIYTRKILLKAAKTAGLVNEETGRNVQDAIINNLRNSFFIRNESNTDYFRIIYGNEDQEISFKVLNAVVDAFIKDTADTRKEESRSAFEFIDQQVETYKKQLLIAEHNLKEFKSKSLDGSASDISKRINSLRIQIEDMKLLISETQAKKKSIKEQLRKESKYVEVKTKIDAQRVRLEKLRSQLDILRLSYQETYPDIVVLKEQIASQELVIKAMLDESSVVAGSSESSENPLFGQLRTNLADIETTLKSQDRRMQSMNRMLKEEYARAERIASREAELSELNRDYAVTQQIYEDMLGRKESARLSMTLDIVGQGVNYKIQEPAVYPLSPSGIQFLHFAMFAPFVGLAVAIGLVVAYILLDARARSPIQLMNSLPPHIEMMAVIPHVNTPFMTRMLRSDMMALAFAFLVTLLVYGIVVYSRLSGAL
jgi:polysaccharide chain length determinant protein (PEP-CTERM system associated)